MAPFSFPSSPSSSPSLPVQGGPAEWDSCMPSHRTQILGETCSSPLSGMSANKLCHTEVQTVPVLFLLSDIGYPGPNFTFQRPMSAG